MHACMHVYVGIDCPPIFTLNDLNYIYIKRNNLLIACTTRYNVSPNGIIELLNRLAKGRYSRYTFHPLTYLLTYLLIT